MIQPSEFPKAAQGDTVTTRDGILKYGIGPAARSPTAIRASWGGLVP
ncbi:hypothetical protein ACIHJG_35810 [Streptomyces sp. NPDC052415]